MYLKKLELKGFKSFPNKTEIIFEKGITSIVGPNGSGKSNVSDAIRWVLGEQSIKSLRGEKLEDVIFAGSDIKKPMNYCEVALTIDNSDKILDIDYSEVTIKRVAYKSGESEFYLNNKSCRLKDIKEILLDTGIGREGYSVIEQGRIDEILSSNSANRRKVFDEACGISKYRYKKQEGEKNLKTAKENLDRINDIFYEIENQLKPLEIQKDKSLEYIKLKDELKILEVNNYINEIEALDTELKEINNHKDIIQNQLNDFDEIQNKEKDVVSNLENNLSKVETKMNECGENIHKLKTDIEYKKSDLNLLNEKVKNIDLNQTRIDNEIIEIENNIKNHENEYENLIENNKQLEEKLNSLKEEKLIFEKNTKTNGESLKAKEENIENLKNDVINLLNQKNDRTVRLSSFNTNLENMNNRESVIKKEIEEVNFKIKERTIRLEDNIKLKDESKEKLNNSIENKNLENKNLGTLKNDLKNTESNINHINLKINEYDSKLNIYYEMEKQYEGFNRGTKEVLKNTNIKGILGAVAEIIKVPKEYETAIEVALGASLQNIITEDENTAKNAINYLKKNNFGRVTFLPLNIIKGRKINLDEVPKIEGLLGVASDKLSYNPKFKNIVEYMLGKTILVENVDIAIKLGKMSNHKYKIVTLQGEIFNPGGSLTGGSIRVVNSILSRKRIIEEFEESIVNLKKDLDVKSNEKKNHEISINHKINVINNIEQNIKNEEKMILTIDSNIEKIKEENSNFNDAILKLNKENEGLNSNLEYTKNSIKSIQDEIGHLENKIICIEKSIKDISVEKEQNKEIYEKDIENLNNINLDIAKFIETYKNKEREVNRINQESNKLRITIEEKKKELQEDRIQKQNLEEKLIVIKVEKEELREQLKDIEIKFEQYKVEKSNILNNLKLKKEELNNIHKQYLDLKESVYKLDFKIDKLEINQENYFDKLWNDYELTYHEASNFKDDSIQIEKKKIEFIKNEMKKLGNVNLNSIEEYKEVKERHDFYKEQKEDLEKSIECIEMLIKDLEDNMKFEFSSNFEKINETFILVYKKLFGGGYSHLKILDHSNILESDIEIIAQPPGKKLKNISLLSGGEKALTAICVLFAILLIKPTPFCVLDEIEAPLDDANIYRFGEFLKELCNKTQFITITHRRGTMQASDYIYGVTMQEKAISKVVSLKLEEAESLTEENII